MPGVCILHPLYGIRCLSTALTSPALRLWFRSLSYGRNSYSGLRRRWLPYQRLSSSPWDQKSPKQLKPWPSTLAFQLTACFLDCRIRAVRTPNGYPSFLAGKVAETSRSRSIPTVSWLLAHHWTPQSRLGCKWFSTSDHREFGVRMR